MVPPRDDCAASSLLLFVDVPLSGIGAPRDEEDDAAAAASAARDEEDDAAAAASAARIDAALELIAPEPEFKFVGVKAAMGGLDALGTSITKLLRRPGGVLLSCCDPIPLLSAVDPFKGEYLLDDTESGFEKSVVENINLIK